MRINTARDSNAYPNSIVLAEIFDDLSNARKHFLRTGRIVERKFAPAKNRSAHVDEGTLDLIPLDMRTHSRGGVGVEL